MRGTRPPEGYQLFIAPKYVLKKGDTVRVPLARNMGEILSIFMGSRDALLFTEEIANLVYSNRYNEGPELQWSSIQITICLLRKRLREYGITLNLDSKKGRDGYRFTGFGECEALPKSEMESHRTIEKHKPKIKTTYEMRREMPKKTKPQLPRYQNRHRPPLAPPKVLPPEYVAAQQAPWHFPERHLNANTGTWNSENEGD